MRKLLYCVILGYSVSCTSNSDPNLLSIDSEPYPQKWELVQMSGQVQNSETTGDDMLWQEYYLLNSDGSFSKIREHDSQLIEGKGIYEVLELLNDGLYSNGKYLLLTYPSEDNIIGNCTQELTEYLQISAESTLIGTWHACDGPGLEYKREE